jgi:hypothetical protein
MARTISIVFSQTPSGVPEPDYQAWYDAHLGELLEIPGFETAELFCIVPEVLDAESPAPPYSHVALFRFAGDPAELTAGKKEAGLSTKESYIARKEACGESPALPDWWGGVRFASWIGVPVLHGRET